MHQKNVAGCGLKLHSFLCCSQSVLPQTETIYITKFGDRERERQHRKEARVYRFHGGISPFSHTIQHYATGNTCGVSVVQLLKLTLFFSHRDFSLYGTKF